MFDSTHQASLLKFKLNPSGGALYGTEPILLNLDSLSMWITSKGFNTWPGFPSVLYQLPVFLTLAQWSQANTSATKSSANLGV